MANQRRNNPAEMTVTEQILKIREEICDNYCKYRDLVSQKQISQKTFETVCEYDCPLRKI